VAKGKPTDNAEHSLEVALKRCRALLRPHDTDAVVVLTKAVVDEETGEQSDLTICVPLGRISVGQAVFAQAVEDGVWCKPSQLPETLPPEEEDEEEDEEADAE
jgi:hypothetical protein